MSISRDTIAKVTWAAIAGALIGAWESPWIMVGAIMAIAQFVDAQWGEQRSYRLGSGEVTPQAVLAALRDLDRNGGTR